MDSIMDFLKSILGGFVGLIIVILIVIAMVPLGYSMYQLRKWRNLKTVIREKEVSIQKKIESSPKYKDLKRKYFTRSIYISLGFWLLELIVIVFFVLQYNFSSNVFGGNVWGGLLVANIAPLLYYFKLFDWIMDMKDTPDDIDIPEIELGGLRNFLFDNDNQSFSNDINETSHHIDTHYHDHSHIDINL